jgi:hypothetical protein
MVEALRAQGYQALGQLKMAQANTKKALLGYQQLHLDDKLLRLSAGLTS